MLLRILRYRRMIQFAKVIFALFCGVFLSILIQDLTGAGRFLEPFIVLGSIFLCFHIFFPYIFKKQKDPTKPNVELMKVEKGMSKEQIKSNLEKLLKSQGIKIVEDKKRNNPAMTTPLLKSSLEQ